MKSLSAAQNIDGISYLSVALRPGFSWRRAAGDRLIRWIGEEKWGCAEA